MMQPRSPHTTPVEASDPTIGVEPSRRKRKRPIHTPTATQDASGSETDDHDVHRHMTSDEEDTKRANPSGNAAPRGPYRGKCLYQSRKCENERALKRNGKPHNLCDEHRNKQNQHQRKFDAKKYTRKKRKHSDSEGDDDEGEQSKQEPIGRMEKEEAATKSLLSGKRRAMRNKRSKVSPTASESAYAVSALNEASHSASAPRPLATRRPPALDLVHSSPHASYALPPVGHVRSPLVALGHGMEQQRRTSSFGNAELYATPVMVPPATPGESSRPFPSPHGSMTVYPFLHPPPPSRSRSFDAGVTRMSPMGGAVPGSTGLPTFNRPRQFLPPPTPTVSMSQRRDKLPSLQELPLGQLARSGALQSPYAHSIQTVSPPRNPSPYTRQSPPSQQLPHSFGSFPRPPQPLLPSLRGPFQPSRSSPPAPHEQDTHRPPY